MGGSRSSEAVGGRADGWAGGKKIDMIQDLLKKRREKKNMKT